MPNVSLIPGARRSFIHPLPLLAGLLWGAAFPPSPLGPLAWAALVPLLLTWDRAPARLAAVDAFLAFLTAGLVAFGWVLAHPFPIPRLASAGGLATWAFLLALPWPLAAALRPRLGRAGACAVLAAGLLAVEAFLQEGPWAFPWGLAAHTQAGLNVAFPLAAHGGLPLVSAWVLALNGALFWTLRPIAGSADAPSQPFTARAAPRRAAISTVVAVALLATPVLLSTSHPSAPNEASADTSPLRLLAVQPNLPPITWADGPPAERIHRLLSLSRAGLDTLGRPPHGIVWPETALPPQDAPASQALHRRVQAWVDSTGVPLIAGGIARAEAPPEATYRHVNRVWLFRPSAPRQTYDKQALVPFAERVPGAATLPALARASVPAGGVRGYQAGEGPAVWTIGDTRIAPLVCFESTVPSVVQAAADAGAEVLLTVAQTGWWGTARAPAQHAAFTRLATAAPARPTLLVPVQGPITLIPPSGSIARLSRWGKQAVVLVEL